MNIAELGIKVDSADAAQAATDLDKLTKSGERAEQSAVSLMNEMQALEKSLAKGATTTQELTKQRDALAKLTKTGAYGEAEFTKITAQLDKQQVALIKSTMDEQKALNSLLGAIDPARAAVMKLDTQVEQLGKHLDAGRISQDLYNSALGKIDKDYAKLEKTTTGFDKLNLSTKQSQQNVMQLIGAFQSGDWMSALRAVVQLGSGGILTDVKDKLGSLFSGGAGAAVLGESLAGVAASSKDVVEDAGGAGESLSSLAESSNAAADAAKNAKEAYGALPPSISGASASAVGLTAAVIATAAAVGVLIYGYTKGSRETDEYNKALILTGKYAGTSAGQLSEMARQVSASNGTTGEAAASLVKLASSAVIASSSFKDIAAAAAAMDDATGKSVDSTIAEFVKIAKDPVDAAKELNGQYNFLTASVYSQIVALKEQGDTVGAADLLTKSYADTIQDRSKQITDNLGLWQKGWEGVKDAASSALDSVNNIGRSDINADIERMRNNLAHAESRDVGRFQNKQVMIDFYTNRLNMLEDQRDAQADIAKWEGDQAKAQSDAVTAMSKIDALTKSSWTNEQKRAEAIKDYKKHLDDIRKTTPNDSRLNQSAIDKNLANINDKFKDPKAAAGSVDLTSFNHAKNVLAETLAYYKNADKELEASQRAGVISQVSYTEQRVSLLKQQSEEVTQSYQSEIDALEAIKTAKGTTAAQLIQIDQKISDARSAMVKAQQNSDSELAIIATNEEGRLRKQTQAVNTYTSALQQQVETLRQQGLRAASSLGQGDRKRGLSDQQNGIDDRFNQQRLELANQYGDGSRAMSLDEYTQKLAALKTTQQDLHDTVQSNYDEMTAAQGDWSAGASSAWQNYLESARDVAGQTKSLFSNAFSSMEDAVVKFSMTGKLSFADFTKSILADMARIATRQASSALLSSLFGAAANYFTGSGTAPTSAGSTQAGYTNVDFSGYRADGGSVEPNSLYEVNELGPELYNENGRSFLMTGANGGSVTPLTSGANVAAMSSGGGQGSISVNAPVSVVTQDRSSEGMQIDQQALERNLQTQMKAAAERAVADSWRAGGISFRNANGRA